MHLAVGGGLIRAKSARLLRTTNPWWVSQTDRSDANALGGVLSASSLVSGNKGIAAVCIYLVGQVGFVHLDSGDR